MKKLILLLPIITICYACQKQTIEPIETNSNKSTQSSCGWDGTYVSDSSATVYTCSLAHLTDTIVNLSAQIVYLGDSTYYTGQVACKYDLDNATKSISYLDSMHLTAFHINTVTNYKQDTILLKTKSNKYFALVKH